jgi:hypothetical protein
LIRGWLTTTRYFFRQALCFVSPNNFTFILGVITMKRRTLPQLIATKAAVVAGALVYAASSHAIVITADNDAMSLAAAVAAGASGLTITGATFSGHMLDPQLSSGTFTNASNTYGIGPGIVISTGNVLDYADGPNTEDGKTFAYDVEASSDQEALLDPITGGAFDHFDVTQLDLTFDSSTGNVFFLVTWGTDEYPEFIGSSFIDAFGLYLNGVNIAQTGGQPVNVDHPDMQALTGTELDGILAPGNNPVLLFSGSAMPTGNTLSFIIADSGDAILDATAYISSVSGVTPVPPIPVPAAVWLFCSGLLGLIGIARRKA